MSKTLSIIIGRFQPLHNGHINLINNALKVSDHLLLVIGHGGFVDYRHFLPVDEIKDMLSGQFKDKLDRITINHLYDKNDDSKWILRLSMMVDNVKREMKPDNIIFVGSKKDINWYCNLLPDWTLLTLPPYKKITATGLRTKYFLTGTISEDVPEITRYKLLEFKKTENYSLISNRFKEYCNL